MQIKSISTVDQPIEEAKASTPTKAKSKPLKKVSDLDNQQPFSEVAVVKQVDQPTKTVTKPTIKPATVKAPKVEAFKVPVSDQIWNAIKDRELGLFGLTGQTIEKYCTPLNIDPDKCMLKYKVSSVIPALEGAVLDFDFEVMGAYLIVSKKS